MSISRPRPQRGDFPPGTRQYGSSELGAPLLWFPAPQADSRSGLIIAGTHGDENSSIVTLSCALRTLKPGPDTVVYCCGPMPMMRAVHGVCAELDALCYASLEALMACGDGVCMGCVVEANVEIEAERMVRVCSDGPVFDSRIINWSA